jgi:hypothetical protein
MYPQYDSGYFFIPPQYLVRELVDEDKFKLIEGNHVDYSDSEKCTHNCMNREYWITE